MPSIVELPWRRIAYATGYWLLSLWLIFIFFLVATELFGVYVNADDYRRIYFRFDLYKASWWLYFALLAVGVVAQVRCLGQRRSSQTALASAIAVPVIQAIIVTFELIPPCCT